MKAEEGDEGGRCNESARLQYMKVYSTTKSPLMQGVTVLPYLRQINEKNIYVLPRFPRTKSGSYSAEWDKDNTITP